MADGNNRVRSNYLSQPTTIYFRQRTHNHVEDQNITSEQLLPYSLEGHPGIQANHEASDSEDLFSVHEGEEADEMVSSDYSFLGLGSGSEEDGTEELETTSDQDEGDEMQVVNLDGLLFIDDAPDMQILRRRPRRHHSYLHYRHERRRRWIHPPEEWEDEDLPELIEPPIAQQLANELRVAPGEDQGVFVDAVIYMMYPVALHSLPLAILILSYYQFFPVLSKEPLSDSHQWPLWLSTGIACISIIGTVGHLVSREDFRAGSRSLVKQKVQLTALIMSCMILVLASSIGYNPPPNEFLPQNLELTLITSWRSWTRMMVKCFCIGYSILSTIEIPAALCRMANTNPVFCQVLAFEIVAILLPTFYIALPFILMDFASVIIAPERQSIWLWHLLHFLAVSWICVIIVGVMKYPEIDVQRRQGEVGYRYMEFIKSLQIMLQGHVFKAYLSAAHFLFLKLIRPPIMDGFQSREDDYGGNETWAPVLYFRQISQNVPPDQWQCHYPYPMTMDFWMLILFGVSHLRSMCLVFGLRQP